jgi:hypothetical protein
MIYTYIPVVFNTQAGTSSDHRHHTAQVEVLPDAENLVDQLDTNPEDEIMMDEQDTDSDDQA